MKKLICLLTVVMIFSCGDKSNSSADQKILTELSKYRALADQEQKTRKYAEEYIEAVNSPDWRTQLPKYLKTGPDTDKFLEEHAEFRKSFPNFKTTIKHIVVEGNECILWLEETANFVEPFSVENSDYGDNVLNGIAAKNQPLAWTEVWYFDVVDGKFGGKWDFLKDNYKVLKDLGMGESK